MAYLYSIDLNEKIVCLTFPGKTGLAEILEIMCRLASDEQLGEGFGILVDARTIDYLPSTQDVWAITELASELALFSQYSTAVVVCQTVHYGMGYMMAFVTESQGVLIRPFYEVEQAKAWLQAGHE